ncbi:MAG: DUF262 domain-containing protein [Treponema sp.]|uniref:DUF262 domain-containing protein n=1 Tax=Treponema sp. TaxID=166 RepID=UPI001D5B6A14|nr:DUF262 domain-containing protein [Treponema sp.]MBS7310107.1 DUF262 domain-containing protein [Treponema sp.]
MSDENLKIVSVAELLKENLGIPIYQRPYRWTTESAALLFNDIHESFLKLGQEYRIGTVVLHNDSEQKKLMIVDGQQRLTTLSILVLCIQEILQSTSDINFSDYTGLLNSDETYSNLSLDAARNNYKVLKDKCLEIKDELIEFFKYISEKCTFVKIITDSEQQAFQFFDSQNSRGKELAPHDLLKSYHLREMSNDNLDLKLSLVGAWEKVNQKKLALFFQNHLYPLTTWYKGKSGLNYSSKHIKTFKGLKQDNKYNYAIYHKAANLYIEHFNSDNMFELTCSNEINQFQLTQPVVAGRRFFSYTLYYLNMYEKVCSIIEKEFDGPNVKDIVRDTYGGNGYIRNLFINIIMFYIDKFDFDSLSKTVLKKLFKWAYSLRLKMYSVYPETVNNYALGNNNRANYGLRMFNKISEMTSPSDMDSILLDTIKKNEINNKNDLNTRLWTEIFGGQNE